jgi:hypothetical protein
MIRVFIVHPLVIYIYAAKHSRKAIRNHKVFQFKKSSCGNNIFCCSKRTTIVNKLNFLSHSSRSSSSHTSHCCLRHESALWQSLLLPFLNEQCFSFLLLPLALFLSLPLIYEKLFHAKFFAPIIR